MNIKLIFIKSMFWIFIVFVFLSGYIWNMERMEVASRSQPPNRRLSEAIRPLMTGPLAHALLHLLLVVILAHIVCFKLLFFVLRLIVGNELYSLPEGVLPVLLLAL